jgi:hypothetical protein
MLYIRHVRNKKIIHNFNRMKMILIKNLEIYKLNQTFTFKYKKIFNLQIFKKITLQNVEKKAGLTICFFQIQTMN